MHQPGGRFVNEEKRRQMLLREFEQNGPKNLSFGNVCGLLGDSVIARGKDTGKKFQLLVPCYLSSK